MDSKVLERVRSGAAQVLDEYHQQISSGGEPPYPRAAADVLALCTSYEAANTELRRISLTQVGPLDI